jgi:hypothetical protein
MDMDEDTSEVDVKPILGKSDKILLIALLAFIVFLAVAVFVIITDTRGLWIPGSGGMQPMHNDLLWKALELSF